MPRKKILWYIATIMMRFAFLRKIDRHLDGGVRFFFKHFGKTKFMVSMAKQAQRLGVEKLYYKGPKAFLYFVLFYLVRDTILYILIPILFARWSQG